MCGILGTLPISDPALFKRALDTLSHRGPDDAGVWVTNDVTLGHRRLSILDLSQNGRQPMHYSKAGLTIVFNGEIYNFIELRAELEKRNYRFQTESDTEVILAAYCEWREGCLNKFNGMWAFAIWDDRKKELFLARDRFGKKPLFYSLAGEKFIFASEMKAIYPFLKDIKPSKDFSWMARNIFLYESTDKCLIEGIKRFPSGSYGIYKDGHLAIRKYWDTLDHLVEVPAQYEEQCRLFRELFIDACKIRMRSDVPVGTALSGGLDSSATISTMAHVAKHTPGIRISKDWQHAFVATFPDTPIDEKKFAQKVVENIGIPATYLPIDPLKDWDKIEDYVYLFEELYITTPIPMIQLYRGVRDHGTKVTIDGHGADELLGGYGFSLLEALPDAGWNFKKIKSIFDVYDSTLIPDIQFSEKFKNMSYFLHLIKKNIKARMLNKISMPINRNPKRQTLDYFNQYLYGISHETILPTLLRNYDRYSMLNGVEIRMPFLDHRIVSFCLSLPWESKIRGGFTKSIARDALKDLLPEDICHRKTKVGFNSPIVDWIKGPLKNYFLDAVNSKDFKLCPLINSAGVKKEIENVIHKKDVTFNQAADAWTHFTPFLIEKAIIKRRRI
ncbi:MAG TPA: asparagine synthase (glutamine-hydrolyzing) [Candidatus Omnitrophota bacterium]|nr:asparagine synthase (glutamine-hydrolyzing) [Candidatus Omnitrophota bacterium]HPD85247.1 asparagine synthase (glutamine-hydrolyzing) [Candidatus Omnitrophota bacterium]HRZ04252.1 asparagine synthase (glutamine-hydrolyzing) [Candidatus Omnitrophota bacterium]